MKLFLSKAKEEERRPSALMNFVGQFSKAIIKDSKEGTGLFPILSAKAIAAEKKKIDASATARCLSVIMP